MGRWGAGLQIHSQGLATARMWGSGPGASGEGSKTQAAELASRPPPLPPPINLLSQGFPGAGMSGASPISKNNWGLTWGSQLLFCRVRTLKTNKTVAIHCQPSFQKRKGDFYTK